jgi:hypothetical protein
VGQRTSPAGAGHHSGLGLAPLALSPQMMFLHLKQNLAFGRRPVKVPRLPRQAAASSHPMLHRDGYAHKGRSALEAEPTLER